MFPPRFQDVPLPRGHYESYYLVARHPSDAEAVWIRYTVHKRPGGLPTGSIWFTLFEGPSIVTTKTTLPRVRTGAGEWLGIGKSYIGPREAVGDSSDVRWRLAFSSDEEELRHLPAGWMYKAPLPRTKLASPHPQATFSGTVTLPGSELTLDGWSGMVGHNWGSEHAERWIWLHASFGPRTWFDVALGRIRVGRLLTPWVANGALSVDGHRHRVGGLGRVRGTEVVETYEECRFTLPGDVQVRGRVERTLDSTVVWPYADPSGGAHHSMNSSISGLSIEWDGSRLQTDHGAVYELGVRETDHGLPVQPFEDG
jgi:hypothetical protein